MTPETLWWAGFIGFVLAMLALDLGVFHREPHAIKMREALTWTGVWVTLSLLLLLNYFHVPPLYRHRVLFWGILGALVMRAAILFAGVALLHAFHWVIYVFAAILIFGGFKMWRSHAVEIDPRKNPVLRLVRRFLPVAEGEHGQRFLIRQNGALAVTPLFVVLILVEWTDLVFAVDSIPAVLAVTVDPFIVFTSNVMAILGLRSLYFALAGIMERFHLLHYGLAAILVFVGAKMLLADLYKVPTVIALGVVAGILIVAVIASLLRPPPRGPSRLE